MIRDRRKFDKTARKPMWKFKKDLDQLRPRRKICSKCKRRKIKSHHYLCNECWVEKKKRFEERLSG